MTKQKRKRLPKYLAVIQAHYIADTHLDFPNLTTGEIAKIFGVRYQRVYNLRKVAVDKKPTKLKR